LRTRVLREEARDLLSRVRTTVPWEALAEAIGDDMLHEEFDRTAGETQSLEEEPDYLGLAPDEALLLRNHPTVWSTAAPA
jgi:hypothetical protein